MARNQKIHGRNNIALLCFFVVVVGILAYAGKYVQDAQRVYVGALNKKALQADKDTAAISGLYNYVRFAESDKPISVLPFQIKQQGVLALVNKQTTLAASYIPRTLEHVAIPAVLGNQKLYVRPETNAALREMYAAAKNDGIAIMVRSAYRSYDEQMVLWRANGGDSFTAEPGKSEHQTGLAVDINSTPITCGNACSLDTATAIWLAKNAPEYGFILRYPEGKTSITGYSPERWHFRYVGKKAAIALTKANVTLDEAHIALTKAQQ